MFINFMVKGDVFLDYLGIKASKRAEKAKAKEKEKEK